MKLSITDQFLWDLYKTLSKAEDQLHLITHPPRRWSDLGVGPNNPLYTRYRKILKGDQFKKLIYYLKRNNYIKSKNLHGERAIVIDRKGFEKISKIYFKNLENDKTKRGDGKLIMLIFDVPEKYRKSRHLLRNILKHLGYKMFQQSVWITPCDVSEKTEELLQEYNLDKFVRVFLIEKI